MSDIVASIINGIISEKNKVKSRKDKAIMKGAVKLVMRYDIDTTRQIKASSNVVKFIKDNFLQLNLNEYIDDNFISNVNSLIKKHNKNYPNDKIKDNIQKHHVYSLDKLYDAIMKRRLKCGINIKPHVINIKNHEYGDEIVTSVSDVLKLQNIVQAVLKSEHK